MKLLSHQITHQYQSTNHNCSQTALSIALGHYSQQISADELMQSVPVLKNEQGQDIGTINQQLATWCQEHGYKVTMYSFDFQILDLSWGKLGPDQVVERLEATKLERNVPNIGKHLSEAYAQSYIDFIKAGGELHIQPHPTTELLYSLLDNGPFLPLVSFNVLWDQGRTDNPGLRQDTSNDLTGHLSNHTIVVYGRDEQGSFLIADPWQKPGLHTIEPERLLAAITAALIECDNLLFQISK